MTTHAEDVLLALLDDVDAVETLAREGLLLDAVPTEALRPVVQFAIDYYFKSGRLQAPSKEAIRATWGKVLDDAEASLGDGTETDTIEWAIDDLKANYVTLETQRFFKAQSAEIYEATNLNKVKALAGAAYELTTLALSMASKQEQAEIEQGVEDAILRYRAREEAGQSIWGMTFGLPEIDAFIGGIHDGEVGVLAAPPKTGKSYWMNRLAFLLAKTEITVLFTLENSVEMTYDRIVCMACGIDADRFRRGECTEAEIIRFEAWKNETLPKYEGRLIVIQPEPADTTMVGMMRQAEMYGAKNVLIDQLTFVNHPEPGKKARHEIIRDLMHELKNLANGSRHKMRVMIAHQINREGVKAARKNGFLEMDMLAEGAEVERTADFVFGLYQSHEDRGVQMAKFQILAARRTDTKAWSMNWDIASGMVSVSGEVELDSA